MSVQGIGNHAAHQLPQEMRSIQKQEPNGGFEIANQSRRFPFSKMEIRRVY